MNRPFGGFGAAAGTNRPATFGAAAPAAGGGGFPAFGAPAAAAGTNAGFGFSGAAAPQPLAGGFGAAPLQQQAPTAHSMLAAEIPSSYNVTGRYLMELDRAYNALHPDCKFRTFCFNMCTAGQGEKAVERERFFASQMGGGCRDDQWFIAKRDNPDPECMYPCPVHFFAGLLARGKKQQETIEHFHKHVDCVITKIERLRELEDENNQTYRRLVVEQKLLERKWMLAVSRVELMRQTHLSFGEEKYSVRDRCQKLLSELNAPGKFKAAIAELQPFVDAERQCNKSSNPSGALNARTASFMLDSPTPAATADNNNSRHVHFSGNAGGMLQNAAKVDVATLQNWAKYLQRTEDSLERLYQTVQKDTRDAQAVKDFIIAEQHHQQQQAQQQHRRFR